MPSFRLWQVNLYCGCMRVHKYFLIQFDEKQFCLRERIQHLHHCDDIEADQSKSVALGVNYRSVLFELTYFDVDVLVPDVMHDLLEGVLQYETSLILKYIIRQQHYMTYQDFSKALNGLELGYMEADNRPTDITSKTISSDDKSLGQKGLYTMNACTQL